jgi:hypothetical protein
MAEFDAPQQDWLKPHDPFAGAASQPRLAPRYDLRPLSTGEILDRTFALYRSRFWLFAGLSSLGACVNVLSGIVRIALPQTAPAPNAFGLMSLFAIFSALIAFAAYSITHAATTSAVAALYLGEDTSVGAALRSVRRHWIRYPLIAVWQSWSFLWVFLLLLIPAIAIPAMGFSGFEWLVVLLFIFAFASLIYGIIAYIRNSLAVPASVIEDLAVRASMRRSKLLTDGTKGRIFLLLLLLFALYMVAGTLQVPFAFILLRVRSTEHIMIQAITLFITFLTGSLLGPVGAIGGCLFYFDQRVRKEAFDIEFLMDRTAPSIPASPISAPPVPETAPTEPA